MILPTEAAIEEEPADLVDDDELWRHQASSLAVFVTPAAGTTFRLPEPARRDGRGVRPRLCADDTPVRCVLSRR
jgi:hypothetical protein